MGKSLVLAGMSHAAVLRDAQIEDEPLLFALFAEEKSLQWFGAAFDRTQLGLLLEMQYRARRTGYLSSFPRARQLVIVDPEAGAIGQVLLQEASHSIRIIDLCVANAYRGRGIGGSVLRGIEDEAAQSDRVIELQVTVGSAAKRLYARHGFEKTGGDEVMEQMIWTARATERSGGQPISNPG